MVQEIHFRKERRVPDRHYGVDGHIANTPELCYICNMSITVVKQEFPNGWDEFDTSFELFKARLDENGFKITSQKELYANEMILDARPHTDEITITRNGKSYTFSIDLETDLREGREFVRDIHFPVKQIKFTLPPDGDVHPICAAIEYWVRDLVNYLDGKPIEKRIFDTEKWERIRREEYAKAKRESDARWNDYLQHPEKYFGPPPRLVEPEIYPMATVAVQPVKEPVGLALALKFLCKDEPLFRKDRK